MSLYQEDEDPSLRSGWRSALRGRWGSLAALGMTICSTGKMRIPRCARD